MSRAGAVAEGIARWFPLIVLVAGAVALAVPGAFSGWTVAVPWLLALIMLGMGMTLRPVDFAYVATRPVAFVIGVVAQFVIMPLLGWLITMALPLSPEIAVGVILVACAPGGTASNVMVYLARGDVALSVAMTSVSTLLAPLLTPLLVLWLAGSYLPVAPGALFLSIVQVVLVPVVLGFLLRRFVPRAVERALPVLPLVSVLGITAVVMAVVAGSAEELLTAGLVIVLAVIVHNVFGLVLGYGAARLVGLDESARRAISIEVGMQNSGLSASLATTHFTAAAALPAAVFSVWHNISGSLVAGFWARRPVARTGDRAARRSRGPVS
ncbi:bile acid:sodium symporter family protein [Actinomycetospora cinnamomea]|uniref:BASS family bile acid:Na+ symporter n=1 Tax=Actinomycetospora cinnamomea TaxID=663609 RepID=A0A2U1EXV2_9PSEU|nr:bile acid:sodium symporter family protein [Actinomycetospora cinnamomea]PVZ04570.1 BASS family bile acid:Na+ symporter [Actinomycetospora cinnamomea]